MLFNSFGFIFIFLPIVAIIFFFVGKKNESLAATWLALASLFFYAWWDYRYLPLLLFSIITNYIFGYKISKSSLLYKASWLRIGIIFNIALLAYYKYSFFFVTSLSEALDYPIAISQVALPIGISFFTFTQIAFLVDTYQGKVNEYRFIHYVLFVTYFPHLIAGPVLHHKEMMPQFGDKNNYKYSDTNIAIGLSIFIIGLAKKVLIADNIAPYANEIFDHSGSLSLLQSWGGVLSYAFQIYFDFSGYSDMAIGLSRIFGVKLPLNFNSPYKSVNIIDFWRRWHMTLSRFLRDYLYFPLGGNRLGVARRHFNLMTTMLLGGLWHGAGWTFIIWGALHGFYLMVNHSWLSLARGLNVNIETKCWKMFSTAITFTAVCFAWVFFRSENLSLALKIANGMMGGFGVGLPNAIGAHMSSIKPFLEHLGVDFYLGGGLQFLETWIWILFAAFVSFFMPNTQEIMNRFDPALDFSFKDTLQSKLKVIWTPNLFWATTLGIVATLCLLSLNKPAEFLYFQF